MKKAIGPSDKVIVWIGGEIKTPPMSSSARVESGFLLRKLQQGELVAMPHSRPMPSIGRRCHELRVPDKDSTWRIIYRIDSDAVIILEVFSKKTQQTPKSVIDRCNDRLARYDNATSD